MKTTSPTSLRVSRAHALLGAALVAMSGVRSADAEIQIGSDLSPKSIPEGESTNFLVRVVGDGKYGKPIVKTDASVKVEDAGASQSLRIRGFGGATRVDVTYSFSLTPTKKGTFEVQAEVPIEGDSLFTESATLTVREKTAAERARDPFLKIDVERKAFYVGESVPFKLTTFLPNSIGLLDIGFPTIEGGNFIIESYGKPVRDDNAAQGFQAFVFESTLSALKPGEYSFGPAKQKLAIREPFGMRVRNRAVDVESEQVMLTVKPLPAEGKPPGFAGAVGHFTLDIDASPLKLRVGEPISIELRVGGEGNFDALTLPELTRPDGWKPYPGKKIEVPNQQTGKVESLSFNQVVVPESETETIPPFRLTFFDPAQEAYVTLETDAIPIEVSADPMARQVPVVATTSESPRPVPPDAAPPVETMEDILTILSDTGTPLAVAPPSLLRSTGFWVAQSLPLGALAAMMAVFIFRRNKGMATNPENAPRPFAECLDSLRAAPAKLPALDFYNRARSCVTSWEFHHPKSRQEDADSIAPRVAAILERHDLLNYSGNEHLGADPVPERERLEVIESLQSLVSPDSQ